MEINYRNNSINNQSINFNKISTINDFTELSLKIDTIHLPKINENEKKTPEECREALDKTIGELNAILNENLKNDINNYSTEELSKFNDQLIKITDYLIKHYTMAINNNTPTEVNERNVHSILALFAIGFENGSNIYRFLISTNKFTVDHGYQLEDALGDTIIHMAVRTGNIALVQEVTSNASIEQIKIPNQKGFTPLGLLLESGKDLDAYNLMLYWLNQGIEFSEADLHSFVSFCNNDKENRCEFLKLLFSGKDSKLDPLVQAFGVSHHIENEFIKTIVDNQSYEYYNSSKQAHLLELLLDIGSGNHDEFVREEITKHIQDFADTIDDDDVLKKGILEIAKAIEGLNKDVSYNLESGEIIFKNPLEQHSRYFSFKPGENNHTITVFDGGYTGAVIKNKAEGDLIGAFFKNQSVGNKPLQSYGITPIEVSGSIEELKQKIQAAVNSNVKVEDTVEGLFENTLLKSGQRNGSCTVFSLLLMLKYLLAKLELNTEKNDAENAPDFNQKLKDRIAKKNNLFSKIEKFIHAKVVDQIIKESENINFTTLKETHPDRYQKLISAIVTCAFNLDKLGDSESMNKLLQTFPLKNFVIDFMKSGEKDSHKEIGEKIILFLVENTNDITETQTTLNAILKFTEDQSKMILLLNLILETEDNPGDFLNTIFAFLMRQKCTMPEIESFMKTFLEIKNKFGKSIIDELLYQSDFEKMLKSFISTLKEEKFSTSDIQSFITTIFEAEGKNNKTITDNSDDMYYTKEDFLKDIQD